MKIILLVPDGVGVRNYLFSSFTTNLIKDKNEVLIFHKLSESAIDEIKLNKPEIVDFIEIPNFIEKPKTRLLRESLAYARLLRFKKILNNNTILNFWNPCKKGVKKKILYFLSEILGGFLSTSDSLIRKGDELYEKRVLKSKNIQTINNILLKFNPDIILNLHQRAPSTSPVIESAKKLNIKAATVIFSWDNVPKARLISRYNYYFVWSSLMKKELGLLYPEINKNQIKIVGTPQFEFYFEKEKYETKAAFFNRFGLDINKKTICFSGNDLTSPYEAKYLEDICEAITKIKEKNRPQILFRRCPVDKTNRFDEILKKYNHLISLVDPDWRVEKNETDSFMTIYPAYNDVSLLINTVKHSDLVINLGSTMAHDFAVLDRPCLYLNYNPVDKSKYKVEDIFKFQHFKSMNNIKAVGWINNKEEIITKINLALEKSDSVGKDRKEWLNRIVLHPLHKNSEILKKTILECI